MRAIFLAACAAAAALLGDAAMAGNPPPSFIDRLEGDAPGVVQVGGRVNLSWSARAQACTYSGSSFPPGVRFDDWPTGSGGASGVDDAASAAGADDASIDGSTTPVICGSMSACMVPRNVSFFLAVPGNYHFQVTCVTAGYPAIVSSTDVLVVETPTAAGVALNLAASTPGPVRPGDTFDYTMTLANRGDFQLSGLSTTLSLPGEVAFVSSTCASATNGGAVWALPNGLAGSQSASCKLSVRLNAIPSGETVQATARAQFTILTSSFTRTATELISTLRRARPLSSTRSGAPTTENSVAPIMSGDGSVVLFATRQRGISSDDSNVGGTDIVLKNRRDGSARLVSVRSADGVALRGNSSSPAVSANGRAIAFIYEPLAAADANGEAKGGSSAGQVCNSPPNGLFRPTCTTTAPNGQALSGPAESPSLSADGNLMAFCSSASNWVSGDSNGAKDVFLMNTASGAVSRISVDSAGVQGNADSCDAVISGNGKYVAFLTRASNLGGTANWQVVRKNLQTGQVERLSQATDGSAGNSDAGRPSISYDGLRVTFSSRASNLVSGLLGSRSNVYIYYTPGGAGIQFDAPKDLGSGLFGVRNRSGGAPNGDAGNPSISCNGQVVAFGSSASDLVSGDIAGNDDVFVVDAQTGATRRALAAGNGGEANGDSGSPALNCEGTTVAFESAANNIDPNDPNGNTDIYVQEDPQGVGGATPGQLGASYSGNWFNPGQSGHGFLVEALPDGRYYVTWYAYVSGQPLFLQGVAPATGNVIDVPVYSTRSTAFPVGASGVTNTYWGRLRLTFANNDTASVQWIPTGFGFTTGNMTLRRLTAPALIESDLAGGTIKACYSGVWFEPARSGYGFNLEAIEQGDGNRAIVTYWYTYRPDGSPLWLSGVGRPGGGDIRIELFLGGGGGAQFPFDFTPEEVTQTRWGSATLRFTSDDTATVTYTPVLPGYTAGSANLVRLTELAGRRCVD